MELKLTGKIKLINETRTFDSGFQKREFVVTTKEQYPQDIKLECIKDRVTLLDNYNIGDEINVSFNLRGNEYNDRYYVNLQAWKIEAVSSAQFAGNEPPMPDANEVPAESEENDDLPF